MIGTSRFRGSGAYLRGRRRGGPKLGRLVAASFDRLARTPDRTRPRPGASPAACGNWRSWVSSRGRSHRQEYRPLQAASAVPVNASGAAVPARMPPIMPSHALARLSRGSTDAATARPAPSANHRGTLPWLATYRARKLLGQQPVDRIFLLGRLTTHA